MNHQVAVDTRAVERYFLNEMPVEERDSFEEHLFECETCAADIRAAAIFKANAKAVFGEEHQRAPDVRAPKNWFEWLRPVVTSPAFAAVLLVVLGWESLVVVPRVNSKLAGVMEPRQVMTAVLRPESRGTPPLVRFRSGQPLQFAFDLPPEQAFSSYQAEIQSSSGRKVAQIRLAAPTGDAPLYILIPDPELQSGQYTLVVRGITSAGQPGPDVAQYRFELQNQELSRP